MRRNRQRRLGGVAEKNGSLSPCPGQFPGPGGSGSRIVSILKRDEKKAPEQRESLKEFAVKGSGIITTRGCETKRLLFSFFFL